uniref:Uncharacterized protein n=1 Tax=Rhizophora mucronata TaxID=61149 RepID=A0A2P2ITW1_RHIMU
MASPSPGTPEPMIQSFKKLQSADKRYLAVASLG